MPYFAISAVIVVVDQWTKYYMSNLLALCEPGRCESIIVLPVFRFTLLHNEGAAFSFLDDAGGWQRYFLVGVSSVVSAVLVVWLARIYREQKLLAMALALILGGAVGNLIDRAFMGYVVDFLVFHWEDSFFPAFNIADSAITCGAALLILDMFVNEQARNEEQST